MISLPWLLKHQTFPVKASSVPRCSNFPTAKRQCLSCSVKLHLNIYLVCYLSNLSQRRYIYCIYLYPQGFHAPILCTLQLQLLACAALADCLPSAITCQAKKNTQEDTTDHITCFLLNSSMITSVLPLARDREDGGSDATNNVPLSHIHRVTLAVIRNRKSMCN